MGGISPREAAEAAFPPSMLLIWFQPGTAFNAISSDNDVTAATVKCSIVTTGEFLIEWTAGLFAGFLSTVASVQGLSPGVDSANVEIGSAADGSVTLWTYQNATTKVNVAELWLNCLGKT